MTEDKEWRRRFPDFPVIDDERYECLGKIGSGGMGSVYKAQDHYLQKVVAVKVLKRGFDESMKKFLRFQREAKATGRLKHAYILSALDFGITVHKHPYLILDYIDGSSLAQLIRAGGPRTEREAIEVFKQVCEGMSHAHKNGILHRDLKPSNLLLTKDDQGKQVAKIIDFGLATVEDDDLRLTETGETVGSPCYMSPEQVQGLKVDNRSDIYSLGCLMFITLTGQPPFKHETDMETMEAHVLAKPPSLASMLPDRTFSRHIERVVAKCLAKNVSDRYQTADELLEALSMDPKVADKLARNRFLELPFKHPKVTALVAVGAALTVGIMIWCSFPR